MEQEHNFLYDLVNDTLNEIFSPEWSYASEQAIQEYIEKIIFHLSNYNERIFFIHRLRKAVDDRIGGISSLITIDRLN